MGKRFSFLALIMFLLMAQLSLYSQTTDKKVGAVWMWGSTLGSESTNSIVKTLTDSYTRRVYLLVKGSSGTKTNASTLTDFITKAHANNIRVDLWYIVGQDDIFLSSHPDAHQYHCPSPSAGHSTPYIATNDDVNFLYPGYKDYVLNNIKYFLTNFNCDGIHLDHIRFSHLVYSFDTLSLKMADSLGCNTQRLLDMCNQNYSFYVTNAGFVSSYTNGDTDVVKWFNMRKNIIYDYIQSIRSLIQEVRPGIALTAAFMPEGSYSPDLGDVYYAQNYSLHSKVLDMIAPMAYFDDYGQSTDWLKTVTAGAIKQAVPNCKIYTGLQAYGSVTSQQLKEEMSYAVAAGAAGLVAFRYGTITSDEWGALGSVFKGFDSTVYVTNAQMLKMCSNVCSSMSSNTTVPDTIYTDSTKTSFVSTADFYNMMTYYLRYYKNNDTIPSAIPLIKNIAGPVKATGVQTGNQILLADILAQGEKSANYIDTNKVLPNCVIVDTVSYDLPSMFWVFARTINYYYTNNAWPNYATVKTCTGPSTWTCGDIVTAVEEKESVRPLIFSLNQNYPNPFNPSTTIEFQIQKSGMVSLKVYDLLGREVTTLLSKVMNSGSYKINFSGTGLPSGTYFYRITLDNNSIAKKMILLK
jgi:uncharacterized lipoprotein YddW (UPF0748 family)